MTERVECEFAKKEYDGGGWWVMVQTGETDVEPWRDGFFGFELREGVTEDQVVDLVGLLNRLVTNATYTDTTTD